MSPIDPRKNKNVISRHTILRRKVLAGSATVGATALIGGQPATAAVGKTTFTILHTNDIHSNLIGMAPSSDYTPFKLNDDATRSGFARLATLIAARREARKNQGPRPASHGRAGHRCCHWRPQPY
jgi:5'-nucleotidase/UDP-sugar diphosphatase